MKKVVLAYSGGLDTSVAIKWLNEKGYSVICYLADVGQGQDFSTAKKRALKTGALKVITDDLRKEFVEDFVFPALKANAVYQDKYLLATALSRPLISKGLVKAADKENADYIAHGCTGKGNDQVRFEVTAMILNPKIKILAPVREWDMLTRDDEIEYAKKHNIPIDVTKKKPYSIDKNLWGISIESGKLENPWFEPPDDIYQVTKSLDKVPKKHLYLNIVFKKGIPVAVNGRKMSALALIEKLNKIGGNYGIGRSDIIEDRLVGIKSREIYESPAGYVLLEAHKSLERLTLDRETLSFKDHISRKYARLVYDGLWYSPLKEALDCFIDKTQEKVNGTVRMKLKLGHAVSVGVKSDNSLYKKNLATYGDGDCFDQSLAKGFIEIFGLPYKNNG